TSHRISPLTDPVPPNDLNPPPTRRSTDLHCDEPLLDTGSGKNIILLESNIAAPAQRLLTADKRQRQAGGDREPQRSQQSLSFCSCAEHSFAVPSRWQSAGADECEGRLKRL